MVSKFQSVNGDLFFSGCAAEALSCPRRKKERSASKKVFSYLAQSYVVHLCCEHCFEDRPLSNGDHAATGSGNCCMRIRPGGHAQCRENRLVIRERESKVNGDFSWIRIRECPADFKPTDDICESFLSGETCRQRKCRYPHSAVEKELWMQCFGHARNGSNVSVESFINDLRNSTLRVRYEVELMWQELQKLPAAELKLICQECWKKGNGPQGKRPHAPECQNGHHWNSKSKKLVLDFGDGKIVDVDSHGAEDLTDGECNGLKAVSECQERLLDLTVTDEELIAETKRVKEQEETAITVDQKSRCHLFDVLSENVLYDDSASTSDSYSYSNIAVDDESQIDVEEDTSRIYDDEDLEDTATVCTSDLDSSDDEAYAEDPYYQLKSVAEARDLLASEPDKYKRCTIHLDGPFSARCRMLDEGFRVPRVRRAEEEQEPATMESDDEVMREVEIRGRSNCGPCFDGDEVVVQLKKTKELDGDKIIYRGSVIAVLAKKIRRKAYTFVCRVDVHHSHLMKPLDGVAPKIHVVNSILKNRYADRKDELVAVYSMVDKSIKLQKIIKLDPRQRRDMLFVVRYTYIYYYYYYYAF